MTMSLRRILMTVLTLTCSAAVATEGTPQLVLKARMKKATVKRDEVSLLLPSFVIHGSQPDAEAAAAMPRRMDKGGDSVITPGAGLEYKGAGGLLMVGAVLKDCYDNLAGTFQVGEYFNLTDRTSWGLTVGFYARETPYACTTTNFGAYRTTNCHTLDDYSAKFLATVNGESVDVIPMPFLHFSTALYKDRDFEVQFKVMSNVVLNEFGFSVPF